ncbi:MAG: hypothetical protein AAFO07_07795 [Bacteroidota bacterium]
MFKNLFWIFPMLWVTSVFTQSDEPLCDFTINVTPQYWSHCDPQASITISLSSYNSSAEYLYSDDSGNTWQTSNIFLYSSPVSFVASQIQVKASISSEGCTKAYVPTLDLGAESSVLTLNVSIATTTATTCGTGQLTLDFTGGTTPFKVFINGTAQPEVWSNSVSYQLGADDYDIKVQQKNKSGQYNTLCYFEDEATIEEESGPSINNVSVTPSSCFNEGKATIQASSPSGGNLEYKLNSQPTWQDSPNFTGLSSGSHTAYVRYKSASCDPGATYSFSVGAGQQITRTSLNILSSTSCSGNGSISFTVSSDPSKTVEYRIDGKDWQSSSVFTGLAEDTYNLYARYSDETCSHILGTATVQLEAPSLNFQAQRTHTTRCNTNDGKLKLSSVNGNGSISNLSNYQVSLNEAFWYSSSKEFTNLPPGSHTIYLRASSSDLQCFVYEKTYTINQSYVRLDEVDPIDPTACGQNTQNGSIDIDAHIIGNGAVSPYYSIDDGQTYHRNKRLFEDLEPGIYKVRVAMDENGSCAVIHTEDIELFAPILPTITSVTTENPTQCQLSDGTIMVQVQGNLGLEYSNDGGISYQSSNVFNGLAANSYDIKVRIIGSDCTVDYGSSVVLEDNCVEICDDQNKDDEDNDGFRNCLDPDCADLEYCLCGGYTLSFDVQSITDCADGSLTFNLSGIKTGDILRYSIDGGINWANDPGFLITQETTFDIVDLVTEVTSGLHAFRCIVQPTEAVSVPYVGSSSTLEVTLSPERAGPCDTDGQLIVESIIGQGPFELRVGGVSYPITIAQAMDPLNLIPAIDLPIGDYSVEVYQTRDIGGINSDCYFQSDISIEQEDRPVITNVIVTPKQECESETIYGQVEIVANSLYGNVLEYSINNFDWQDSPVFSGLGGSSYQAKVRNKGDVCYEVTYASKAMGTISAIVEESIVATSQTVCDDPDGSINIDVAFETGEIVEYSIDGGASWQESALFTDLSSGSYLPKARYKEGSCEFDLSPVNVNLEIPEVTFNVSVSSPTQCLNSDGTIRISSINGSTAASALSPYEYSVDDGDFESVANYTHENLGVGTYTIRLRRKDASHRCFVYTKTETLVPTTVEIEEVTFENPTSCSITANEGSISTRAILDCFF